MISIGGIAFVLAVLLVDMSIGLVVFLRDTKRLQNRLFMTLATCMAAWSTANIISDNTTSLGLSQVTANIAFSMSFLAMAASYAFFHHYAYQSARVRNVVLFVAATAAGAVVFGTPLVYQLKTLDEYQNGPLYIVYLAAMVALFVGVLVNLVHVLRTGTETARNQVRFMLVGFFLTVVCALLSNALIPLFVQNAWTTKLGPLFPGFFILSVAYAIIKHRLFDIRWALARSVAYVLTGATAAAGYLLLILLVSKAFIHDVQISASHQVANLAIALFVGLTFQPLKSFFDKITNRVFFRDAYDPQHVLHELGAILVRAGSRKEICAEVTSLLENDMKISRVRFLWTYGNGPHNLLSAPQATSRDSNEIHDENLAEDLRRHHSHTIIVDDLPLTSRNGLGEHLRQEDVSIVLQISTQRQRIGYLLLGGKRGGNVFTDPDVKLLETLAAELALAMQNALRYEEIANFNLALQSRVESATKELRQSNEKLKALDETKDDFISMASHQLRTPLTSVKGYLSLVIEGDAGQISEQQRKLLNQAFISSQRMVYLISDLLNVSRLRTGKFIIEPAPVNLSEVIEDEIAQLVETAESREITLKYDKPKEFPTLMLDETKTRQVIMNFIDNAIYYTPAGGRIDVHLVNKPTTVELKVVDNGIGVPKAEQHHLFTKFYRAKNARKARPDGTGLGLFMAKKVITAQGGAIVFDSQEDKGSTFGFTFSKSKLAVKPGAAAAPPQTVTVK